jgi:hypothetical protein
MNRILISSYFLLFILNIYGQKIEKKTIYIEFKIEKNCLREQKFFYELQNGTVFNLFCEKDGSFLNEKKADTLSICKLKNYKLSSLEDVEILEKKWRKNNSRNFYCRRKCKRFRNSRNRERRSRKYQTWCRRIPNNKQKEVR